MRLSTLLLLCASTVLAQPPDPSGPWEIKLVRYGDTDVRRIKFEQKDGRYSARMFGLSFDGTVSGGHIDLACTNEQDARRSPAEVSPASWPALG